MSMSKPLIRKRKHESERKPRTRLQQLWDTNALDTLDLVTLFNGLKLFDDRIEKINVKDVIHQEFIDRIGKLYKPIVMKQEDWIGNQITTNERFENNSMTKIIWNDEFFSIPNDGCPFSIFKKGLKKCQESQRLLIEYEIISNFQDYVHKYFTEDLPSSLCSFEDRGLAVISLRHTFKHSESLNYAFSTYVNTTLKKIAGNTLFKDDSECDSGPQDIDIPKKKRRKVMFDSIA